MYFRPKCVNDLAAVADRWRCYTAAPSSAGKKNGGNKTTMAQSIPEVTREPLLPTEIGDSANAESETLDKSALGKLISEEDVPRGPYPIKTKTAGWALMYLSDEDRYAYYKKKEGNPSRLDVGWQHVNTGKKADKVTVTIRQQIFDQGKKNWS